MKKFFIFTLIGASNLIAQTAIGQGAPAELKPRFYQGKTVSSDLMKDIFNLRSEETNASGNRIINVYASIKNGCEGAFSFNSSDVTTPEQKDLHHSTWAVEARWNLGKTDAVRECQYAKASDCEFDPEEDRYATNGCTKRLVASFAIPRDLSKFEVAVRYVNKSSGDEKTIIETLGAFKGSLEALENDLKACVNCSVNSSNVQSLATKNGVDPGLAFQIAAKVAFEDSKLKEEIGNADKAKLAKIKADLMAFRSKLPKEYAESYAEVIAEIATREETLKADELSKIRDDIAAATTQEELTKLEASVKAIANRNKKEDSEEQKIYRAFLAQRETLYEKSVKEAKTGKELETAIAKYRDFAVKNKKIDEATKVIMDTVNTRITSAKKEDLAALQKIAEDWNSRYGSREDYPTEKFTRTIATLAGKKLRLANDEKDLAVREDQLNQIREMLDGAKVDGKSSANAQLDSLIDGIDRQRAHSQAREMIGGVMQDLAFMSPWQAQMYGPQMIQEAIYNAYGDLYNRAQSNYNDACYGLNYGSKSYLGGAISFAGFTSTGGPTDMEGRIGCRIATSNYNQIRSAVANENAQAMSVVQRAVSSQQQPQAGATPNQFGPSAFNNTFSALPVTSTNFMDPSNFNPMSFQNNFLPFK